MKAFIKNIFIFSVFFLLIDKIFLLPIFYAPSREIDTRLEKLVNGAINKDIIIIGSSRGARDIIAEQIEDSMGCTAYNLSYPGSNIEFHKFILETLLKYNTKPKRVLLVVDDPDELLVSHSILFRFDRLYPLVKYNYINDVLVAKKESSPLSRVLALARLKRSHFHFMKRHFSNLDTIKSCGSMPISFRHDGVEFKYDNNPNYPIANELPVKIESFCDIQKLCNDHEIDLNVIFPPNYKKLSNSFEQRVKQLYGSDVLFFTYDTLNPIYRDSTYFSDVSHLQTKGAVIFTNEIIEMLVSTPPPNCL